MRRKRQASVNHPFIPTRSRRLNQPGQFSDARQPCFAIVAHLFGQTLQLFAVVLIALSLGQGFNVHNRSGPGAVTRAPGVVELQAARIDVVCNEGRGPNQIRWGSAPSSQRAATAIRCTL